MKSNNPQPQSSVPLPREARFNPNGSDLVNEKFNLPPSLPVNSMPAHSGPPANGSVPAPAQAPASSFSYNDPDSFFAFLAPSETPELPELDFPVPGPDVIPDMVFENEHCEESVIKDSRQHKVVTPPSINSARTSEPYYAAQSQYAYVPSKRDVRDVSSSPRTSSSSSISPSTDASGSGSGDDTRSTSTSPSDSLIPIQSSYVAHARVGTLSVAAIQERRARNTQSARRSRARRADKVAELRGENNILLARNKELTLENARLQKLVNTLQMIVPDVKPEVNESPYESF